MSTVSSVPSGCGASRRTARVVTLPKRPRLVGAKPNGAIPLRTTMRSFGTRSSTTFSTSTTAPLGIRMRMRARCPSVERISTG